MSVENFDDIGGAIAFLGEDTPEHCFYCHKPLAGIAVYWRGAGGEFYLHTYCQRPFGEKLMELGQAAKIRH